MTTVRELAEELGVSTQTIRRYIKQELGVATEPRKMLQLDATQAAIVADHFKGAKGQHNRNKEGIITSDNVATESVTNNDDVAALVTELKIRVAGLEAENDGLKRENELLRDRLAEADRALEREQMQSRGFWNRLGQKLLGSGKD